VIRDMVGVLFRNRSQNPRAPIMRGKVTIGGVEYKLSLWTATDRETGEKKADKNGDPYWTIKVEPDESAPRQERTSDDRIPF